MASNGYLVWVDCEMTGLDPQRDELVEIAVIVTDEALNVLDDGLEVVIKPSERALAEMSDFVREMHQGSGLLERIDSGVSVSEAEKLVLDYVSGFVEEPRTAPMAGNSIGTDRMFVIMHMPALDAHLHYRNIDVSSIKELARRWYPRVYFQLPKKAGSHRALSDIRESISELRYYREALFVPEPGPSSEEAQQIAAKVASLGGDARI